MKTIFLAAMMAASGFAMDSSARFNVDFPFTVGKTKFPAGQYIISIGIQGQQAMRIMSSDLGPSAFLAMGVANTAKKNEVKGGIEFACGNAGCTIERVLNLQNGLVFSSLKKTTPGAKLLTVQLTKGKTPAE